VEISCEVDQENILFSVSDTGIGISVDMQTVIFEPFRQVETGIQRNYGGNGLGLSIVKAYLKLLQGTITVKSEINKGTTFYLSIPAGIKPVGVPQKPIIEPKHSISTILIAEDEYTNYQYLLELLNENGTEILHAQDGEQALEMCKANKKIDLVLMDIKLPKLDGYNAAIQIKKIRPNLPIIAQTAFALESEKATFFSAFDDYITKPINGAELKKKLLEYFDYKKSD